MRLRAGVSILSMLALAGCGGSGGGGMPVVSPQSSPTPSAAANVTFTIAIPNPPSSGSALRRAYVSAATQSIVVTFGGKALATTNVAAGSPGCTAGPAARTCGVPVTAPAGTDVFTITAFDRLDGTGNVLSSASLSATVAAGPLSIPVTMMTGSVSKITLVIANPYPPAGTAMTTTVSVQAYDVDGSTILGAFSAPVTVSDLDESGITKLSGSTITNSTATLALTYNGGLFHATTITAVAGALTSSAPFAAEPTITHMYSTPQVGSGPFSSSEELWSIVIGPDGQVWSAGQSSALLARIATNGTQVQFPLPDPGADPWGIASGPDGRIWIAQYGDGIIGAMTTAGVVSQYRVPAGSGFSEPADVAAGPDGNMYATDQGLEAMLRITPSGKFKIFPLPNASSASPQDIVTGPDGNLWITDSVNNTIDVMSTAGSVVALYTLSQNAQPYGITVGPDKNVWFTELSGNRIGRITTGGALTEFTVPTPFSGPCSIAPGPDGNLWFTECGGSPDVGGKFGYVTTDGVTIQDFLNTSASHMYDLAFDASGTLWITVGVADLGYSESSIATVRY